MQSKSTWYARGCATGVILDFDDPAIQSFSQRRRIKPCAGSSKRLWHPAHFFARVSFQNVISSGYLPALHGRGLDCVLNCLAAPLALDSPTSWISVTASFGLREPFGWDDLGLFPTLFGYEALTALSKFGVPLDRRHWRTFCNLPIFSAAAMVCLHSFQSLKEGHCSHVTCPVSCT